MSKRNRDCDYFFEETRDWLKLRQRNSPYWWKYMRYQSTRLDAFAALIIGTILLVVSIIISDLLFTQSEKAINYFFSIFLLIVAFLEIIRGITLIKHIKNK
jgi:hypothetical protein